MPSTITPVPTNEPQRPTDTRWRWDLLAGLGLAMLAVYFLSISWRKWPDPLVDFGRELYTPWQLSQGSVLYRDVEDVYGPLSQYINATLFALFGPGLMVLVSANLAVFGATLLSLYLLFRKIWGVAAAFLAGVVFVAVFGFSQLMVSSNYNFVTPYSHESTHGFFVVILLVSTFVGWVETATKPRSLAVGFILGLTAILKPEFMLAGGGVTFGAVALRWRALRRWEWQPIILVASGAVLPTIGFSAFFARDMPLLTAVASSSSAWLNVVTSSNFIGDSIQAGFSGLDWPWANLQTQFVATVAAVLIIAAIAHVGWVVRQISNAWHRIALIAGLAGALAWISFSFLTWIHVGRSLLGLVAIYFLIQVIWAAKDGDAPVASRPTSTGRILLTLLAGLMMLRMVFNGRVYHYGFYQAALAGILVPAVLVGDVPLWISAERWGRRAILLATLALLLPGIYAIAAKSRALLQQKTLTIGEGADMFYVFPQKVYPQGQLVKTLTGALKQYPDGESLLVLPEGPMINYLARKPNPVSLVYFFASATRAGGEQRIMRDLELHPPRWAIVLTRDLREYGIPRYGEKIGEGKLLIDWLRANYERVTTTGGDPLDNRQSGGWLLRRKNPAPIK